jgi:hypothetical protein
MNVKDNRSRTALQMKATVVAKAPIAAASLVRGWW